MKVKKMLSLLLVVSLTGGFSASALAENNSDSVTIKFISQGTGATGWEGYMQPLFEEYEKETGVHIDGEFYSFNDLFDVIETKCAAGNADFDVMSVDVTYVAKYGTSGYLAPLDEYFSDEEKAEWDSASYEAGIWDGTMYAAPQQTSSQLLWYNKTLLDQAGIEVPENDADNRLTYEEVAELAKQALEVLDPDGTQGLIGFDFQQVSRVYQMNMLPNSMGGKNISDDGYSLDGVINTEPWINAMTWYQNLVNDGIASRGYGADELTQLFYSGKMIFMVGGTWTESNMVTEDEIGATYAPCFEGYEDQVAAATGSWYMGINEQSENKDAAADFIKWMTLGSGSDMWLDEHGDLPSRLDRQEAIINSDDSPEYMKIAAYEAANTAYPRAVTPAFGEYSTVLDQAWEDVRNGSDVESTLNYAIEQFASVTASYKN